MADGSSVIRKTSRGLTRMHANQKRIEPSLTVGLLPQSA
jgi:hypothetical protein